MLAIPIVLIPIAFAGGLWLSAAARPPLRPTPTGRLASRVVDLLLGLAAVAFVLDAYVVVRTLEQLGNDPAAFARDVTTALWDGATLVAAAAIVHLLAPGFADVEDAE